MNKKTRAPQWYQSIRESNYKAATEYLQLIFTAKQTKKFVSRLIKTSLRSCPAKDIFRATQLSLLGVSNSHVDKNRTKIQLGELMSPILLVRDARNGNVIVADGYHRLCAVYGFDEDAVIPYKITG